MLRIQEIRKLEESNKKYFTGVYVKRVSECLPRWRLIEDMWSPPLYREEESDKLISYCGKYCLHFRFIETENNDFWVKVRLTRREFEGTRSEVESFYSAWKFYFSSLNVKTHFFLVEDSREITFESVTTSRDNFLKKIEKLLIHAKGVEQKYEEILFKNPSEDKLFKEEVCYSNLEKEKDRRDKEAFINQAILGVNKNTREELEKEDIFLAANSLELDFYSKKAGIENPIFQVMFDGKYLKTVLDFSYFKNKKITDWFVKSLKSLLAIILH